MKEENNKLINDFATQFQLTEKALAEMIGVTRQAIDHWRLGRRDIPASVRKMLAICVKYPGLVEEFTKDTVSRDAAKNRRRAKVPFPIPGQQ